jgi:hypothetical protein
MRQITEKDFNGYPEEVTGLPIYAEDDGQIIGWGHIDPAEFVLAVQSIAVYHELDEDFSDVDGTDISHTYAKPHPFLTDDDLEGEIAFVLCAEEDEGAFPVTYFQP